MNEIKQTEDGSLTLYNVAVQECYHSIHGAKSESAHIFIKSAFALCEKQTLSVLEVGFGTGLNAFLTLKETERKDLNVNYLAIELFPVPVDIYSQLNYAENDIESNSFIKIHEAEWEKPIPISKKFSLHKKQCDFVKVELNKTYDIIYFDAFSPEKQPELWTEELFRKLYNAMNKNGIFITYCAKGYVRRSLQRIGFFVERIPGPVGKREILRASKL